MTRDPNIKYHSPKQLRMYAEAFRDLATNLRKRADEFDAKAVRYLKRAEKLERENDR